MNIKQFFTSLTPDEKETLAKAIGTSVPVLSQIAHGHRNASPKRARELVRAAQDLFESDLTLAGIRPDIWEADGGPHRILLN